MEEVKYQKGLVYAALYDAPLKQFSRRLALERKFANGMSCMASEAALLVTLAGDSFAQLEDAI